MFYPTPSYTASHLCLVFFRSLSLVRLIRKNAVGVVGDCGRRRITHDTRKARKCKCIEHSTWWFRIRRLVYRRERIMWFRRKCACVSRCLLTTCNYGAALSVRRNCRRFKINLGSKLSYLLHELLVKYVAKKYYDQQVITSSYCDWIIL